MNCTQETYRRCLAAVAPREVAAARANGVYAATWNSKPRGQPDHVRRAQALDLVSNRPQTTKQLRARLQLTITSTYRLMCRLERDGLVSHSYINLNGNAQALWSAVTP